MNKSRIVASLAVTAAAALAAGVATLLRKTLQDESAPEAAPAAPAKALRSGSYSFISGFKDAVTVELGMDYDPEKYSFAVIEDEFPAESSDSHVAVVYGENFDLQLEYASYYNGEDFSGRSRYAAGHFKGFVPVRFGSLEGIRYLDGDSLCFNFPIPGDLYSYLLVTLMKAPDSDDDLDALGSHPDLEAMLSSLCFSIR